MIECNHNCLECPYPDVPEECLEAALTWDEYKELDVIDKDIINPKTTKQKAVAAQQKAYYEANKDKIAAQQKAWHEANKDRVAAQQKAWYEANKDRVAAQQKAYREANKDKIAAQQKCIALARKARGMTRIELAAIVGAANSTIAKWETGAVKANWDKLCEALPELEDYRP